VADEDACQIEHVVSRETLKALTDFLAFLGHCPKGPLDMLRHFREVSAKADAPVCAECGLERLANPQLSESQTPVSRQHTRL
jgi:hypothetical protein